MATVKDSRIRRSEMPRKEDVLPGSGSAGARIPAGPKRAQPSTETNPAGAHAQDMPSARYATVARKIAAVLDKLSVDDFRPAVGQAFSVDAAGAGTVELTLVEAR